MKGSEAVSSAGPAAAAAPRPLAAPRAATAARPSPGSPAAAAPPSAAARRAATVFPAFDGLRAIAALLVITVHASFIAGFTTRTKASGGYASVWGAYTARGEIGVAVFFLISGFLLYRPFALARLEGRPPAPLGGYLIRRALRIVPLYWVALTVTVAVEGWHVVHGVPGFLECAFFLQAYDARWALQGVTQAWTLDIEVAFYVMVPVWAWLLRRRQRSADRQLRAELTALAGLYAGSVLIHALLVSSTAGWSAGWHGWLPVWWDLFAPGMALAALSAWYQRAGRLPRPFTLPGAATACWAAAAAMYWLVSTRIGMSRNPLHGRTTGMDLAEHLCYGLFALFLLLPAVFAPPRRGWVQRLLCSRVLASLGLVSYGLYLWHQIVIDELVAWTPWKIFQIPLGPFLLAAAGVTALLAGVTYVVVERPFIALGHDWARRWRARRAGDQPGASPGR
jgi:peptidoglycan/LPS O-acetylase OafA/YrhL